MSEQDELSRLARAITEAEDELKTSNHRDNVQQLHVIDTETRPHLVERIEARETALEDARKAMRAYAEDLSREGAVKVEIDDRVAEINDGLSRLTVRRNDEDEFRPVEPFAPVTSDNPAGWNTNPYSNGLDGHQED